MKKILLLILPFLIVVGCNKDNCGEFSGYFKTSETGVHQGSSNGEDLSDQWSPRTDAPLTSQPAYPNPFSTAITITFGLEEDNEVEIQLLDCPNNVIETVTNKTFEAGYHSITISPDNLEATIEPGKIYQVKIISSGVEIHGNIKYEE